MEPLQGATFENPFRRPSLFIVTDFKPFSRGASNLFDCGKKLWIPGAHPWSPHGAPGPPSRGLPLNNPFRRPSLFIVTDFKPFSRGASNVFDCGKNLWIPGAAPWSPHGVPPGGYLWKSVPAPLLIYCDWFQEVPVMFLIVIKICEPKGPPHGAPMEPLLGGYLWKSVPTPLLICCDWFQTIF